MLRRFIRKLAIVAFGAVVALAIWLTMRARSPGLDAATSSDTTRWEKPSAAGAERARLSLEGLNKAKRGATTQLSAGDLAAYVFKEFGSQLATSPEDVSAAVVGDRLYFRAVVKPREIWDVRELGPFGALLGDREILIFGGTFAIVRPGLAEFRVSDLKVRDFPIPARLIPTILKQIDGTPRPAGVAADGLPLAVPPYIGSVRIDGGRITMTRGAA